MSKNTEHSSLSPFLYIAMLLTSVAPKVMPSILIFWPSISERETLVEKRLNLTANKPFFFALFQIAAERKSM